MNISNLWFSSFDIIIPIFNAYQEVKKCLESVEKNTPLVHNIHLIDDMSMDARIQPLLLSFCRNNKNFKITNNETNIGYLNTVNNCIKNSKRDIILLNSDTIVPPKWTERMNKCLQSNDRIGIVSPLSNNATILSLPLMNRNNKISITVDQMDNLVESNSECRYPDLPTAVGFCMAVKYQLFEELGLFSIAFNPGYGEECDFCCKAIAKGWKVVACDNLFVFHHGSASFSHENCKKLIQISQKILESKHPNYNITVRDYCRNNPLRYIQERIRDHLLNDTKPHILQICHSLFNTGGVELHVKDVARSISNKFNSSIMFPGNFNNGDFSDITEETKNQYNIRIMQVNFEPYKSIIQGIDLHNNYIEDKFLDLINNVSYKIVHFHHLLNWNSLLLPRIAKNCNKKIVISIHDYFLICPNYNLLKNDHICGEDNLTNKINCTDCLANKYNTKRYLGDYIYQRNEVVKEMLHFSDSIIVHSEFVRNKLLKSFGDKLNDRITLIPHGTVIKEKLPFKKSDKKLKVSFLGNFTKNKGSEIFLQVVKKLNKIIDFFIVGDTQQYNATDLVNSGIKLATPYNRKTLPKLLSNIDLVMIISIWDETFCITALESQSLGVPLIATKLGALPERIIDGETGFLVEPNADDICKTLLSLNKERQRIDHVRENLVNMPIMNIIDTCKSYELLYEKIINNT